jgi:hypothetical protein
MAPPARARQAPRRGDALTLLHRRGVRLRVPVHQPPDYGFFYAQFPVPDRPPRWAQPPTLPAGNAVVIPRAPYPDPVLDAALLTMLVPASLVPPDPIFEPAGPAGRLHLPWRQDPLTGLLAPDHTLQDLWWARSFPVCCNITPGELGLPFGVADLDAVAWAVLRRCPVSALVEMLAGLAFGVDILGSPGLLDRAIAELLGLPGELQARLRGTVHHGSPLLDPRCVRWIIRELAVAKATRQNAGPEPWEPATLAQEAIARVLFPTSLGTGVVPLRAEEVLRAVWLHEGFQLREDTAAEADRAMSMVAAITYGVHQSAGMLRFLDRGRRLLAVDDTHPAVAGFAPLPSALREVFTSETGLTTSQWVHGAAILAVRYFNWVATNRPHRATLDQLMELELPVRLSNSFRALVERELITSVDELGQAVLDEMGRSGVDYAGFGSTPKHDSRAMRDRPLLRFDNGYLQPLGFGLLLDRIIDLPRYVVQRNGTLGGDRLVRNILGHMFEGYVTDRIAQTRGRHQVLTEQDITAVLGQQAKRGDAIVGYSGDYLLVEVSVQGLGRGIAAGDPASITSRCERYHYEADQAAAMARRLGELVRAYGLPSVRSWTYLVVTDQALPNSPALANALRRIRPGRNPRFVCGIDEFELLLDAGVPGWSIPALIRSWRNGPLEQTLGSRLQDAILSLTPLDDRDTAALTHDWLTDLPTDDQQVA